MSKCSRAGRQRQVTLLTVQHCSCALLVGNYMLFLFLSVSLSQLLWRNLSYKQPGVEKNWKPAAKKKKKKKKKNTIKSESEKIEWLEQNISNCGHQHGDRYNTHLASCHVSCFSHCQERNCDMQGWNVLHSCILVSMFEKLIGLGGEIQLFFCSRPRYYYCRAQWGNWRETEKTTKKRCWA